MQTAEGLEYYNKWLKREITCRMVRERSGAGLLAKFFSKKTDDDEDQKMIDAAVAAEEGQGMHCEGEDLRKEAGQDKGGTRNAQTNRMDAGHEGQGRPGQEGSEEQMTRKRVHGSSESEGSGRPGNVDGEGLIPPPVWPSFSLKPCTDTLQLESQESGSYGEGAARRNDDTGYEGITAEENERELQFAVAAMDIPAIPPANDNHYSGSELKEMERPELENENSNGVAAAALAATAETESNDGGLARAARSSEGQKGQSDLKHWLK